MQLVNYPDIAKAYSSPLKVIVLPAEDSWIPPKIEEIEEEIDEIVYIEEPEEEIIEVEVVEVDVS